jgi:hypothetical protein
MLLTALALWSGFWLLVYLSADFGYADDAKDMAVWCGLGVPGGALILLYGIAWTIRGWRQS